MADSIADQFRKKIGGASIADKFRQKMGIEQFPVDQISQDSGPGWSAGPLPPSGGEEPTVTPMGTLSGAEPWPYGSKETPIEEQHSELPTSERLFMENLSGGNPEIQERHLQKLGFETFGLRDPSLVDEFMGRTSADRPTRFSIRRPGEDEWRTTNPASRGLLPETFRDLPADIGGSGGTAVKTGAEVLGGAGGAALAALATKNPLAAYGAGVAGAGLAGGAAESALMGLGKLTGLDPTMGETAGAALEEAKAGALGQAIAGAPQLIARGAGKVASGTGKLAQAPARAYERATDAKAREALIQEARGLMHEKSGLAQTARGMRAEAAPVKTAVTEAKGVLKEATSKYQEELSQIAKQTAEKIAKGKDTASKLARESLTTDRIPIERSGRQETTLTAILGSGEKGRAKFGIMTDILDPAYGITAENLKKFPAISEILRKHGGEQFVPALGSKSMKARADYMRTLSKEISGPEATKIGRGISEDLAAYMLADPAFKNLSKTAQAQLAEVAVGRGGAREMRILRDAVLGVLKDGKPPDYLRLAREGMGMAQKTHETMVLRQMKEKQKLLRMEETLGARQLTNRGERLALKPKQRQSAIEAIGRAVGGSVLGGPFGATAANVGAMQGLKPVQFSAELLAKLGRGMEGLGGKLTQASLKDPSIKSRILSQLAIQGIND